MQNYQKPGLLEGECELLYKGFSRDPWKALRTKCYQTWPPNNHLNLFQLRWRSTLMEAQTRGSSFPSSILPAASRKGRCEKGQEQWQSPQRYLATVLRRQEEILVRRTGLDKSSCIILSSHEVTLSHDTVFFLFTLFCWVELRPGASSE